MLALRRHELPPEMKAQLQKAVRYEWLTLFLMLTIIAAMYFTLGSSQSMKTAWIEDILSLVAPCAFLIASRVAQRQPDREYPYGYHRAVSIAFLCGSVALCMMGLLLLVEGVQTLLKREHPTVGAVSLFGREVWLGWLMLGVLLYSAIPPFLLGRVKLKLAEQLHDKTLYADARMNRADWSTALAAMLGVTGIGFGLWWADAVAASFIAVDITRDGYRNLRTAVTDLINRHPRRVEGDQEDPMPERLLHLLQGLPWVEDAAVRLREEGHVFMGEAFVIPRPGTELVPALSDAAKAARALDWRMHELVIMPVRSIERPEEHDAAPGPAPQPVDA